MSRIILDAGALIAVDRNDRAMWARLAVANRNNQSLVTQAGVIGQVWRRPGRQARLAAALPAVRIHPLDVELARAAGRLLATTKTDDVDDAVLAMLCEAGDTVLTSDVDDLLTLFEARATGRVGVVRV